MKTPCRFPGCPALLDKSGYCTKHKSSARAPSRDYEAKRKADPALDFARRVRTGKRWLKVKTLKLSANPICEDPYGDHARRNVTVEGKQVHHIQGLATHPELAYHWDNLMSVCTACHSRIEASVRKGGGE